MAMDNYAEFAETVLNYIDDKNSPVDEMRGEMVRNFIKEGTENERAQVRLSKTIKDILKSYSDSPLNGRKRGTRRSGLALLSEDAQAEYESVVSIDTADDGSTTITLSPDAYTYHTTFSGRKDDAGNPITTWGDNATMLTHTLVSKLESGFVSAHKGDN